MCEVVLVLLDDRRVLGPIRLVVVEQAILRLVNHFPELPLLHDVLALERRALRRVLLVQAGTRDRRSNILRNVIDLLSDLALPSRARQSFGLHRELLLELSLRLLRVLFQ